MNTYLRKGRQAFIFKIVIWVTAATMVFGGLYISQSDRGSWVALVNGRSVSVDSFAQAVAQEQLRLTQIRQQLGKYASLLLGDAHPTQMAVERLVNEELLNEVADHMGITLDEKHIQRELIKLLPRSVIDETGRVNYSYLEALLPHYKSIKAFEDDFEHGLRRDVVMHIVRQTQYIPDFEVKEQIADEFLKRQYSVLLFPLNTKAAGKAITDADVAAFFDEQNKLHSAYVVPAQRAGIVWEFNPVQYGITISQKSLQDYYTKNKSTQFVKKPVEFTIRRIILSISQDPLSVYEQAQKILDTLKKDPAGFAALAKQYSHDTQTSSKDGLFTFEKGSQDPILEQAVMQLKEDEEISDLVKTSAGIEIVQRVKRSPAQFKTFDQVKSEIESRLIEQQFKRSFKADSAKAIAQGKDAVLAFIAQKKGKKNSLSLQKKDDGQPNEALFSAPKDGFGSYSNDNKGFMVQVTENKAQYTPALATIEAKVRVDLQKDRALKAMEALLKEAKAIVTQEGVKAAQEKYGAQLITTGWIKRGHLHEDVRLAKEKVPVAQMVSMSSQGAIQEALGDTAGYLMHLDALEPFDQGLFQEHQADIRAQLALKNRATYESGFIASLRRNATIERNAQLITRKDI